MSKPFIQDLLHKMTLEEKLAQMTQLSPLFFGVEENADLTGPMNEMNITSEAMKNVGSTLNLFGAENIIALQKKNLEENPHGIPLLFMADIIHGYKTFFPIPLAIGCTFNPHACTQATEVAARESAASGIHLTFAPMADLVRDPRWGRVMESPGEDPYLNSVMTVAAVKGFQGDNPKDSGRLAACVKHFAGYGASEGGRDYNMVDMSQSMLHDFYLPAYKAAVEAGVTMVMTAFNVIDRTPATTNKKLFRDILREKWGFDGVVITDFNAIDESITHGYSQNGKEAARKSLEAGIDIEMMSTHYINFGKELVEDGTLSEKIIDDCVIKILELKDALGLFENPYKDASPEKEKELFLCKDHRNKAREVARQSIVLLKNQDVLPLKKGSKIGIAGPFACSKNVLGGWSSPDIEHAVSLFEGLAETFPESDIRTAMTEELGSMHDGIFDVSDEVETACEQLKDCDVIIAAVGENPVDTGEAASKTNLRLSPNQEKMIQALKKLGKTVVTIIFSGRPMEIKPILDCSDALVQGWFLGSESGHALADVLAGDYNPSGRLSMSFPQTVGQIPVYYNAFSTGRPLDKSAPPTRYVSKYLDCPNEALFPFGYGLSYSNFEYSNLVVSTTGDMKATVTVENKGDCIGTETVQLYIHDLFASVIRPTKELKGFQQITLAPNEKKEVTFFITKDMLSFYNRDGEKTFENGEFDIMIGKNSVEVLSTRIHI